MNSLSQKVAIVTGASAGIGRASALLFAQQGARLVVGARRQAGLDSLVSEIRELGGDAVSVAGDVVDEQFAIALVQAAMTRYGRLDVAFNNAGTMGDMGPTPEVTAASWRSTVDTNLTGAFLGAKHQIPAMLQSGGGSLIFTSTFVGHTVGFPGAAAYAASKAGLVGLTQALAAEFGPRGLRVNAILPGGTDTALARAMNPTAEAWSWVESLHALKRIAKPQELAQAVLFLASDASSFMTGAAMLVDGGVSVNRT